MGGSRSRIHAYFSRSFENKLKPELVEADAEYVEVADKTVEGYDHRQDPNVL